MKQVAARMQISKYLRKNFVQNRARSYPTVKAKSCSNTKIGP